jgi:hypothetical protein
MEDGMANVQHEATASEHQDNGQPVQRDTEVTPGDWTAALASPRLVPVALSALLEGLGQAYNRQKW